MARHAEILISGMILWKKSYVYNLFEADSAYILYFVFYVFLLFKQNVHLSIFVFKSNEVKNSCHMEKEGLRRSVEFFKLNGIPIKSIVTDRHVQIKKWIRENMVETTHMFDVWHVAKGILIFF